MNTIVLDQVLITNKRVDYYFSVSEPLRKYFKGENHLFIEFEYDLSTIPESILTIPFVANVIPLAWITNSTIFVNELDESFYVSLTQIKKGYQAMYPEVPFKGDITIEEIVPNTYNPRVEAAQLFSGGLDALATFTRIHNKHPLLITEYGWHKNEIEKSKVWDNDKQLVTDFARKNQLKNIFIHSNYGTFMNAQVIDRYFQRRLGDSWWHGLHHGLAIITAAIPIAYLFRVENIYIASSYFEGYKAKCASDPTIDNHVKYASGGVVHDGYDIHRQQKVKAVLNFFENNPDQAKLRVCFLNEQNCCACEKCMRTILGIVAEGKDPRDFGFNVPEDLSHHVREFLRTDVKFFTPARVMQWNLAKERMVENKDKIACTNLLQWFIHYDFAKEKKRSLLTYRLTKFVPIIKRRLKKHITRLFTQKQLN
ncbi:peptidase [Halobacillus halophilus]|uniref:peptidase n=1 Tax=Halobacillus halophilus TaxID=1570 RepID=UPI001CD23AE7|nr:peptidase [Halobacillus halophilus]MCA1010085.1 peptidase [Halobacillus halophilus]